jgi:hypothetical protein
VPEEEQAPYPVLPEGEAARVKSLSENVKQVPSFVEDLGKAGSGLS